MNEHTIMPTPIRLHNNWNNLPDHPDIWFMKDQVGLIDSDEEDYWIAWFAPTKRQIWFNLDKIGDPFEVEDRLNSEPILTGIQKDEASFVPHFLHEIWIDPESKTIHTLLMGSNRIYHIVPLFSISYEKARDHALARGFSMEIDCTHHYRNVLKRTIWCRPNREDKP